uniref:Male-enhanced antigen 1 n=1 Tax=Anoplophora glabripennis TaxID=217634 RepID=V5I947_ANOGL
MVTTDTGFPDPDNPSNEIRATNDVILVTDDEEDSDDQETVVLDEYQPLATEDIGDLHQSSSDDEGHDVQITNSTPTNDSVVPPITPMEEVIVKEVWSGPPPKSVDIEMDSKRVDEVKQVMMNVTLPQSSIPEWAANIPEEEWKNQLMKRLQNMKDEGK